MENNNPKKSKALIITIIILLIFLLVGYLLYKNKDSFGVKTSATISKIFSPFLPSSNQKDAEKIDTGDSTFGSGNNTGLSGIWNSIFNKSGSTNICINGAVNSPLCTVGAEGQCLNGNDNPPSCGGNNENNGNNNNSNKCSNGSINYPSCTINKNGACLNGATNAPLCTINKENKCLNGEKNPPICGDDTPGTIPTPGVPTPGDGDNTPFVTVTATPASISQGDTTTISWSATNVKSCDAGTENGNKNSNSTSTSGSFTKKPTKNTSYTIKCTGDNGTVSKTVDITVKTVYIENKCAALEETPLLFSPEEKAKLAELLRKYYIISNTLKTDTNIDSIYKDMSNYETLIDSTNELTKKCYLQTNNQTGYEDFKSRNTKLNLLEWSIAGANTRYTGPKTILGNPWYKYTTIGTYSIDKTSTTVALGRCVGTVKVTPIAGIDLDPAMSYFNNTKNGKADCSTLKFENNIQNENDCLFVNMPHTVNGKKEIWNYSRKKYVSETFRYPRETSCVWEPGGSGLIEEYEKILNVW